MASDSKNPDPYMHGAISSKFGVLMMAICEADAIIKAKDEEIANLKAALAEIANEQQNPTGMQEMLQGR